MSKVSFLIPSRNELFLTKTIEDVLKKCVGEIEIICNIDEKWPDRLVEDPRVRYLHPEIHRGMRAGINACAAAATGDIFCKLDAHISLSEGFDEVMKKNYLEDNWILVPRRYSLDPDTWGINENGKRPWSRDYHFLSCPIWSERERSDYSFHGIEWPQRGAERHDKPEFDLDSTMSWQGSLWFMSRKHWDRLGGGLSEVGVGTFAQEPQELGLKTQLGGGEIMTAKRDVFYCHLHKGKRFGRMYFISTSELKRGHEYSAHWWMTNSWKERQHDLEWLIEKWWPVPTWPDGILGNWDKYVPGAAHLGV